MGCRLGRRGWGKGLESKIENGLGNRYEGTQIGRSDGEEG